MFLQKSIKAKKTSDPDFQKRIVKLDKELKIRDGEDHGFYSRYIKLDPIRHVAKEFIPSSSGR